MKQFLFASLIAVIVGCGTSQPGPDGTEPDAIEAYIQANPDADAGLDEINEDDLGVE